MTITLHADDLDDFRLMLREQIAGDAELLRDLAAGAESRYQPGDVTRRSDFLWELAEQVGLYGDQSSADVHP